MPNRNSSITLQQFMQLPVGARIRHNGLWAHRIGSPRSYTVISSEPDPATPHIHSVRIQDDRGYITRHPCGGCTQFVTDEFLASCSVETNSELSS